MRLINRISNVIVAMLNAVLIGKSSEQRVPSRYRTIASWCIKVGISIGAVYVIATRILAETTALEFVYTSFELISSIEFGLLFFGSILLSGLNWSLEMYKWNMLLKPEFGTHWRTSVKGVLTGTTFGMVSPNRMGEFVGRVLALKPSHRIKGALLSFVNSCSQTMATLTFGLVGFMFLINQFGLQPLGILTTRMIQVLLVLLWVSTLFIYFRIPSITRLSFSNEKFKQLKTHLDIFGDIEFRKLNKLYLLSLVRFMTFIGQYILVFGFVFDRPDMFAICGLAMVTLFSSTVLSFVPLPDLMLRETLALSYFSLFDFDLVYVSIGVFLVWLINVAIPAMVGSAVLFSYRIFKSV